MMPAVALGYDPYLNDNEFTVRLHVNSLIVAMGVNLGTLSLVGDTQTAVTINEVANAETVTVVFEGGVYVGKQYIDSLYPVSMTAEWPIVAMSARPLYSDILCEYICNMHRA